MELGPAQRSRGVARCLRVPEPSAAVAIGIEEAGLGRAVAVCHALRTDQLALSQRSRPASRQLDQGLFVVGTAGPRGQTRGFGERRVLGEHRSPRLAARRSLPKLVRIESLDALTDLQLHRT